MAEISDAERYKYLELIKPYKAAVESLLELEKSVSGATEEDSGDGAFKRLTLADEMLNLASNYIIISGVSQSVLKVKDEGALNDGRKSLYKSVIYLEDVVSNLIDAPFSEYEEKLAAIAGMDAAGRYLLIRKMGLAIELLEKAYGDNTKWKWTFVELEGRYAAAAKNIIDLRNAVSNTDLRSPQYEPAMYHLRLAKKLLAQASERYREMYELSTNRIDDFKAGIAFLSALRRLHILLGEPDEAEMIKKKLDSWAAKLEADMKNRKN